MAKVTLEQFKEFIKSIDGKELQTLVRGNPFTVGDGGTHVSFTVKSGYRFQAYYENDIEGVEGRKGYLEFYNEGCRKTNDYSCEENTGNKQYWHTTYFLAVMNEYEKGHNGREHVIAEAEKEDVDITEMQVQVFARKVQGKFRKRLLQYWGGSCSVTGVREEKLLYASHIKPWKDSNDSQRVNKFNGLLLTPNLDSLFDKGFITFEDDGKIKISGKISGSNLNKLGVNSSMRLRKMKIHRKHRDFLAHHRKEVFNK